MLYRGMPGEFQETKFVTRERALLFQERMLVNMLPPTGLAPLASFPRPSYPQTRPSYPSLSNLKSPPKLHFPSIPRPRQPRPRKPPIPPHIRTGPQCLLFPSPLNPTRHQRTPPHRFLHTLLSPANGPSRPPTSRLIVMPNRSFTRARVDSTAEPTAEVRSFAQREKTPNTSLSCCCQRLLCGRSGVWVGSSRERFEGKEGLGEQGKGRNRRGLKRRRAGDGART